MKVKLLVSREGPTVSQVAGDVVDVDDAEAKRMIESGQAIPQRKKPTEKATKKPVETAVK